MIAKVNAEIKTTPIRNFAGMNAELHDADPISDDHLATAIVSSDGKLEFLIDTEDAGGGDSPFEKRPDIYILIKDTNGEVIFHSLVINNVDFEQRDPIYGDRKLTLDLVFSEK
jgi:hypothetical protein